MGEELEVLKQYVEELGLDGKDNITLDDWSTLSTRLREADEFGLADYVVNLGSPTELQDFIVNTIYG